MLASALSTQGLDAEAQVLLRKIGKKDTMTKLKALAELIELTPARGAEWTCALLPNWVLAFGRLSSDASWQACH